MGCGHRLPSYSITLGAPALLLMSICQLAAAAYTLKEVMESIAAHGEITNTSTLAYTSYTTVFDESEAGEPRSGWRSEDNRKLAKNFKDAFTRARKRMRVLKSEHAGALDEFG